ncbi:MAG: hypothetical protein P4L43_13960 [Syntrophobacteraceae bacterium]|nr:hypothetical protein [Syntrophobacteraceae bacterium]
MEKEANREELVEADMRRVKTTKTVKVALYFLRFYLIELMILVLVRLFKGVH